MQIKNINIKKYGIISNVNNVSFHGVRSLEKDMFKKQENHYLINSYTNDEYEGHMHFSTSLNPNIQYCAYYTIDNMGHPPKFELNKPQNLNLSIEEIDNAKKVDSIVSTDIKQNNINSTETKFIAEITEDLGEGCYKAKIKDLPESVILCFNNVNDFKVNDKVSGTGYMAVET